jgi:phospholipid transport system substrate-binding protein
MVKKILLALVLTTSAFSSVVDDIKRDFLEMSEQSLKIVSNKNVDPQERNSKLVDLITPSFDFKLMAKLSLGKVWKTMSKDQRDRFVNLYVKRMKKSYSAKIDKYTNEKIIITSIKQVKKRRVVLKSDLVGDIDTIEVIYKYYKPKKQQNDKKKWLVYDVVVAGISIIKTDKAQFKAVLQEKTIEQLMEKLK